MRSASCSPTRRSVASYGPTQAGMRPRKRELLVSSRAAADSPAPDAAADTKDGSATPTSASAVRSQWPGTDPNRPSRASAFAGARGIEVPVIASPGEILHAREIREQLRKRYLDHPGKPHAPWC